MHTGLLLSGFLSGLVLCFLGILFLDRVVSIGDRRLIQLFVLAAPAVLLGVLSIDIAYMAVIGCLSRSGLLDIILSAGIALGLVGLAVVSLSFHSVLVWRAVRTYRQLPSIPPERAQAILERLVGEHPAPGLKIVPFDLPLAFAIGLRHPTIVLSRWVLEQLDDQELEGVLAHEWAHCLHRDNLIMTIAAWLKDCTFYLFFVKRAFKSLLEEKELLADARAVKMTLCPAALASALFKFSQVPSLQVFPPSVELSVQGFGRDLLETRIKVLLDQGIPQENPRIHPWGLLLLISFLVVLALFPAYWIPHIHR